MTTETVTERDKVYRAGMQISFHLNEIAKLLASDIELTLLMRHPNHPERNAIISNETDVDAVCRDIRKLLTSPARSMVV